MRKSNTNLQIDLLDSERLESIRPLVQGYPHKRYAEYLGLNPEGLTDYTLHYISSLLHNDRNFLLVALDNESPVGLVCLEELAVDSDHFGKKMARVACLICDKRPEIAVLLFNELLRVCSERHVDHLACRVNTGDIWTAHILEDHGFRLMTTFIGFAYDLRKNSPEPTFDKSVRSYHEEDITDLKQIARTTFTHTTRFHVDPTLSPVLSNEFHAKWIENSCHGLAEQVFVAEVDSRVQGFITCEINQTSKRHLGKAFGLIGLIAVSPGMTDRGLGAKLVHRALDWFKKRVDILEVGTESANPAALSFYQKIGFRIVTSSWTFHKVFS